MSSPKAPFRLTRSQRRGNFNKPPRDAAYGAERKASLTITGSDVYPWLFPLRPLRLCGETQPPRPALPQPKPWRGGGAKRFWGSSLAIQTKKRPVNNHRPF